MSHLEVLELDFDDIKEALLTYLGTQTEFNDYDFTGSALNTIVDLLAYFIHYTGIQANFALRESFLESAQLRKNVSAVAKELGYFPAQTKAARTSFTMSLDLTGEIGVQPTSFTVPRGTIFSAKLENNESITFVTYDDNVLLDEGIAQGAGASEILSGTIFLAQGIIANSFFTVETEGQRFILTQPNIDTDFITVSVKPNPSSFDSESVAWEYAKTITSVGPQTNAFFLSEYGDSIEIYFGNNAIGRNVLVGNYIEAEYLVSRGVDGNGLSQFELTNDISGYSRDLFEFPESVDKSGEGADRQSMDSIRFMAPLSYQRQNRIVTIDDYKSAILENYSNVKAINAWGGEDADPPEYGRVFVSIAPVVGDKISPTTKKSIETDILKKFNVVGIIPTIVDPDYLTINLETTVNYLKDKTILKASEIGTQVGEAIEAHFDNSVYDYKQSFKYSKLLTTVDAVHSSIVNSIASVGMEKYIVATSNISETYEVAFLNAIKVGQFESSTWLNAASNTAQIKASSAVGFLDLYINDALTQINIGTIDYNTGFILLTGFNINALTLGQVVLMKAIPENLDVNIKFNNLARLGTNIVTVVAVEK